MKKFLKDTSGGVMVLVAFALGFVLLGMAALAVDVGFMYSERAKMVTAADAAALAGAITLGEEGLGSPLIESKAKAIAVKNGADTGEDDVKVNVETVIEGKQWDVQVEVGETKSLFFGKVLNNDNARIKAVSRARVGLPNMVNNIVPVCITQDKLTELEAGGTTGPVPITAPPGNSEKGNYYRLDFPEGSGSNGWEYYFQNGYNGSIALGTDVVVDTETGIAAGPLNDAVESRLASGAVEIVVPIVEYKDELNGKSEVTIVGFAAFTLTGVSNDKQIMAEFSHIVTDGEMGTGSETDYGVKVVELVKVPGDEP